MTEKVLQIFGQLFQKNENFNEDEKNLTNFELPAELKDLVLESDQSHHGVSAKEIVKKKVMFLSKMMKMQNILRDKSEQIVKIKE